MDETTHNKPDFIIAGVMKGGTTALYSFISVHDDVVAATQKEIHYFSLFYNKSAEWYLSHFKNSDSTLCGEASPTYFDMAYSAAIPRAIHSFNPDVKIILIVRDPVERAISHYHHLCHVNKIKPVQEVNPDEFFSRPFGPAITATTPLDYYLNLTLSFSSYARKLRTYYHFFEPGRILIVDNSELRNQPRETMEKVFRYLGLRAIDHEHFHKTNYSSGKGVGGISKKTLRRLSELLYPDYKEFCRIADLPYNPRFHEV